MNGNVLDFWQDHSLNYLEMAFRHDRRKRVTNPDGYGNLAGRKLSLCAAGSRRLLFGVSQLSGASTKPLEETIPKRIIQ